MVGGAGLEMVWSCGESAEVLTEVVEGEGGC